MAQPDRAPIQQAQERAVRRHTIRQQQGVLSWLRRHRGGQAMATSFPRGLALRLLN